MEYIPYNNNRIYLFDIYIYIYISFFHLRYKVCFLIWEIIKEKKKKYFIYMYDDAYDAYDAYTVW